MSSEKPLTIAVAGLGQRIAVVLRHLVAAAPHARVAGYVDPEPYGLASLAKRHIGPGTVYADVATMLAETKPDLFVIGSPNHLHLGHIKAGLKAGVRIFTEKPIVRTEEETWELARLLRVHGETSVLVGLVMRSSPLTKAVAKLISDGRLGPLVSAEGNEHLHPEHGAFLMRDWRRREEFGGSFLLDKCCHDFDIYRMFIGSLPKRVASFGGRRIFTSENGARLNGPAYEDGTAAYTVWRKGWNTSNATFGSDADVNDHQVAIVEYENGVRLSFHANTHAGLPQRRWYFAGTDGALEADLVSDQLQFRDALGLKPAEIIPVETGSGGHDGMDPAMGRDLAAHLLTSAPFPVNAYDAIVAGLTVMAIDRAMRENTVVDCQPMWEKLHRELGR
ncbi:MAG: Gfo/Idh/MocA family oxidoreductase [Parvibaculum sp.]|nr:Gfo/Idh/MocA family oxidoreductase [Parvibaculum sp.]